jgi:hypothetical protein
MLRLTAIYETKTLPDALQGMRDSISVRIGRVKDADHFDKTFSPSPFFFAAEADRIFTFVGAIQ